MRARRLLAVCAAALAASTVLSPSAAAGASEHGHCSGIERARVPLAQQQKSACLDELTTAGTVASGHTVPADWAGLTAQALPQPHGVPGVQIDGYFPDSSATNTHHGWNHDAQFTLRLPDRWNGGLVVTGSPGNRAQYANDRAIADQVLAQGYAFAATDKGNTGAGFHTDGRRPGDAVAEWNHRVTQLNLAARASAHRYYGRAPDRVLAAGLSNGGYLVRWQLENRAALWDGGVDWEGTLWRGEGPNLFDYLPATLRDFPVYAAGGPDAETARQRILDAGFAPGSEFLWQYHHEVYWDLTQRVYREEFDPAFDGELEAGIPYCATGTPACDADYDYVSRPPEVHRAVERIGLTGRIGAPLITLHGTLDTLLPISRDSDVYAGMTADRGRGRGDRHRYYRIENGTHSDGLVDVHPDRLRPIAPCFRSAFDALGGWLDGQAPPASRTVPATEVTGDGCALGD
ncbi:tannase/feruloyl esterase family alpha/beta hydrolase [Amycolatopsis antarctica]|uniref:Tannase/feruloyl esterase family alpha/beta hydrolase n=1 Tax=Amycolatopsis antarctica TaxID=1854586 RepID=A0A263CVR6_9PSEU|nr:3-hydroxybutyrate oligomer hydrolase family protein [Amycolatopsis antarctica]OZM70232.1 tannase/feruloyl esterase family alpha/beta hydrolase [Amycolatopsis antarctica]